MDSTPGIYSQGKANANYDLFRRYDFVGSMNQAANPFTIPDADLLYMRNVSQEEFGALQKDGGYSALGTMQSGSNYATAGFTYKKLDGTETPIVITGTDLQKYSGGSWSNIATSIFTAGERASFSNFLDRAYITTSSYNLVYTDGSSLSASTAIGSDNDYSLGDSTTQFDITNPAGTTWRYTYDGTGTNPLLSTYITVGDTIVINAQNFNANNNETATVTAVTSTYFEITSAAGTVESNKTIGTGSIVVYGTVRGKFLENLNGESLFLAHLTHTHSTNEVVYTKPGTHQFFNDGESYKTTNLKIKVPNPITGIKFFRGLLFIFTANAVYTWNPSTLERNLLCEYGAISNDTIREMGGNLIWANRTGVYIFDGSSLPRNIAIKLQNKQINSLWKVISGSKWASMAAEVYNDKYYLAVGNLTAAMPGDSGALNDVVIVFDFNKDSWTFLDEHPVSTWFKWIDSNGDEQLLFTSLDDRKVHKRDLSYSHNGNAINMVARLQYYHFNYPEFSKSLRRLFVMMRPQNQDTKYVTVAVATDGSNTYTNKITSSSSSRLKLDGATAYSHTLKRVDLSNISGYTVSLQFSNSDNAVNAVVLGIAMEWALGTLDKNVST